jgi:Uma2 family endonuclease
MSIVAPHSETRIVLSNVSWATFEALVAEADQHGTRFAYDRGILEIMSPSKEHEWYHRLLGRLVEAFTLERNIPIQSTGATTLKAQLKDRGLEPDESYYITNESLVRGCDDLDLTRDPPPDLAIEVEISSSAIDKLAIYGDLGVSEVWFYDGESLRMCVLQSDGTYATSTRSSQLPQLTTEVLEGFLARRHESDETTWVRSFHQWVRGVSA